jgi:hypothetical protein
MSGGGVAYNLRPNKYVERQLFIELLRDLYAGVPRNELVYVSLGGPQLEDPKLVHLNLGIKNLISLEGDPVVHGRQLFNLRPYIDCREQTTGDFISNFDTSFSDKRLIIWLDYAKANERLGQLGEYESLIGQLEADDTIKITMNANARTLGERGYKGETEEETLQRRYDKLTETLGDYLPEAVKPEDMTSKGLVPILCNAIKKAALNAAERVGRIQPVPVAIFSYQDGEHRMLTVTVHLTALADVQRLHGKLTDWEEYLPLGWDDITRINIPNLTAKERLFIEGMLFRDEHTSIEKLHEHLPFRFDSEEELSLKMLKEYEKHYRRYPSYMQVVL